VGGRTALLPPSRKPPAGEYVPGSDAVKDAVPVDDRWFCIRCLD
jgi:hypothetical protein